jgi:hypothetical protein
MAVLPLWCYCRVEESEDTEIEKSSVCMYKDSKD